MTDAESGWLKDAEDRAKTLGWLSAATNAGVAIGPVIGSAAARFGHAAPGLLAAGLTLSELSATSPAAGIETESAISVLPVLVETRRALTS